MSRINRIRLANVNYNENSFHIEDKIFDMNSKDTLLVMGNGGGKSVFVQLVSSLFVDGNHRNAPERPFDSNFTTSEPSYLMVEWELDYNAGYVLTGSMIRQNQAEDRDRNKIEQYNFIYNYKSYCSDDIAHLDLYVTKDGKRYWKKFGQSKKMFEAMDHDHKKNFTMYDIPRKQKLYFETLREYKINPDEWMKIMYRINKGESGLKDLFKDCKSERELIDGWFIPAIETKLNTSSSKIERFQEIFENDIRRLKQSENAFKKRDVIYAYIEQLEDLLQQGRKYKSAKNDIDDVRGEIATFVHSLKDAKKEVLGIKTSCELENEKLVAELQNLKKMKKSYKIYLCEDDVTNLRKDSNEKHKISVKLEEKKAEYQQYIQYCEANKANSEITEIELKLLEIMNQIKQQEQDNKDLEPERLRLGYYLKKYFELKVAKTETQVENLGFEIQKNKSEKSQLKIEQQELQEKLQSLKQNYGRLMALIESYDVSEKRFNEEYHEILNRNMFGVYDEDKIESVKVSTSESLDAAKERIEQINHEISDKTQAYRDKENAYREYQTDIIRMKEQKQYFDSLLSQYDEELSLRKKLIKQLEKNKDILFDKDEILNECTLKIESSEAIAKDKQGELIQLENHLYGIKHGKVLRLEKELIHEFEQNEIHFTYGMDYLMNYKGDKEEQAKLLRQHPLLPYGLILDRVAMGKLSKLDGKHYTDLPIPILKREDLEISDVTSNTKSVLDYGDSAFYVHFDEGRLDPKSLQNMVEEEEKCIAAKKEQLAQLEEELNYYRSNKNKLEEQKVNETLYFNLKNKLSVIEENMENEPYKKRLFEDELKNIECDIEDKTKLLESKETEVASLISKKNALLELMKKYNKYTSNLKELDSNEKSSKEYSDRYSKCLYQHEKFENDISKLERSKITTENELDGFKQQYIQFSAFEIQDLNGLDVLNENDKLEVEARYKSMQDKLTKELQILQREQSENKETLEKKKNDFLILKERYKLQNNDVYLEDEYKYDHIVYYQQEFDEISNDLDMHNKEEKRLNEKLYHKEGELDSLKREYRESYNAELVPKEDIYTTQFESEIRNKENLRKVNSNKLNEIDKRINCYMNNIARLDQYALQSTEVTEIAEDLIHMPLVEIDSKKANLLNTLGKHEDTFEKIRRKSFDSLRMIEDDRRFSEPYYKKALSSIHSLVDKEELFDENIGLIIGANKDQLRYLEESLENEEREKKSFVNELLEYVRDINSKMQHIDKASSINMGGTSTKLLNIHVPDWQDNKQSYQQRLDEYINDLIDEGFKQLDNNDNLDELVKTKLTSSILFDRVVGLGSVDIKIYKIEASKKYKIDWKEVAKSSGAESFTSAFIVLICLLQFMRKDDTELRASYNEGKVLLMDNPFAVIQSEHLITPMMELANKTNTQLICLTAVEEVSRYFDNVYVLSLHTNHYLGKNIVGAKKIKGEMYLSSSSIESVEQEKLF